MQRIYCGELVIQKFRTQRVGYGNVLYQVGTSVLCHLQLKEWKIDHTVQMRLAAKNLREEKLLAEKIVSKNLKKKTVAAVVEIIKFY